jgi:hypothetical protein
VASPVEFPPLPAWLAVLPQLLARKGDADQILNLSLASAAAALAADTERRDSRTRLCFLLAELAAQYGRRTGDHEAAIPVGRARLARAAQISLPRAKRVLGFLVLAGVIELTPKGLRVIDWQRLCKLADYDRAWVSAPLTEEEAPAPAVYRETTVAGDPASFV